MQKLSSRLLIPLVLATVVVVLGWLPAGAMGNAAPATASTPTLQAPVRPGALPTSGEPDIGQTQHPVNAKGLIHMPPSLWDVWIFGKPVHEWFRWTRGSEVVRYLGRR